MATPCAVCGLAAMADSDGLREFVISVGKQLGREAEDVEPLVQLLLDNWYDTPESLRAVSPDELQRLGMPQRFAKELTLTASKAVASAPPPLPTPPAPPPAPPAPPADLERRPKGSWKGKGKGKDTGALESGKGKGGSRTGGGDSGEFHEKLEVGLDDSDRAFGSVRGKLIGDNARNIRHIREQTNVSMWVRGRGSGFTEADGRESSEPMHIMLSGRDRDQLNRACDMASDLITTVQEEYQQFLERGGHGEAKGKGMPKGKGKGKAKGKKGSDSSWSGRHDRDENHGGDDPYPPYKRSRS